MCQVIYFIDIIELTENGQQTYVDAGARAAKRLVFIIAIQFELYLSYLFVVGDTVLVALCSGRLDPRTAKPLEP